MKPLLTLFAASLAGLAQLSSTTPRASTEYRLPSGLELQAPASWRVQENGQAASLSGPGHDATSEAYITGIMTDPADINDSGRLPDLIAQYFPALAQIRIAAPASAFSAAGGPGVVHTYEARSGFTPVRILVYMVDLHSRSVGVVVGIGRRDLVLKRQPELASIAASLNARSIQSQQPLQPGRGSAMQSAAANTSAQARAWIQRLNDKKLVQLSGYSSGGGGGGMSSEKYLFLASDGSYAFRSSSSVSVYVPGATGGSAGRNSDGGRWRVVDSAGQPHLELSSRNGATERIALSAKGSETYLNGRRWYVVGINE